MSLDPYWLMFSEGPETVAPAGFAIVIIDIDAPNGFSFGTTEISGHTTSWDFGDGTAGSCVSTETLEHTYAAPGTYVVTATCHDITETTTVDTDDPPVSALILDSIVPATVPVGGPIRLVLRGDGFDMPMLVRCWCVSTFMGTWDASVLNSRNARVDIDTTTWPEGTGGIDVVVNGVFSNQLQFPVV